MEHMEPVSGGEYKREPHYHNHEHHKYEQHYHKHKHKHEDNYSRKDGKGYERMDGIYNHPNILGGGYGYGGYGGGYGGYGGGYGCGIAPVGLFGLIGANGFGGHHDGGKGCCNNDNHAHVEIMEGLGDIKGEIPLAVANAAYGINTEIHEAENAIQGSITAAKDSLGNQLNQLTIAGMQQTFGLQQALCTGFSNLKDVTVNEAEKTRALLIEESRERDRQRIATLEAEVRQGNITITNTNQQWQNQMQFQDIRHQFDRFSFLQAAKGANENIIVGNAGPTVAGPQTSTPTNVNTR